MFPPSNNAKPSAAADKAKTSDNPVWDKLRMLDAFPKTMDDFRVKTVSGAIGKIPDIALIDYQTHCIYCL